MASASSVPSTRFNTFYAIFSTKSSTENYRKSLKMGTKGWFLYTFWNWHCGMPTLINLLFKVQLYWPQSFQYIGQLIGLDDLTILLWWSCLTGSFDRNFASVCLSHRMSYSIASSSSKIRNKDRQLYNFLFRLIEPTRDSFCMLWTFDYSLDLKTQNECIHYWLFRQNVIYGNMLTSLQTPLYVITTLQKRVLSNEKQTTLALLSFASQWFDIHCLIFVE